MKVLKHLRDNVYEVEMEFLPDVEERNWNPNINSVIVAHDYVEFRGSHCITKSKEIGNDNSNYISIDTSIQIDIKTFKELILPYLQEHEYFQDSHFKNIKHREDDKNFKRYGLTKPRWKKGECYPSHSICSILKINDKIYTRRMGEEGYDIFTPFTFNIVKNSLQLAKTVYEIPKEG